MPMVCLGAVMCESGWKLCSAAYVGTQHSANHIIEHWGVEA